MQTISVNRRQFLKTGAIAAALAASGRLPLLSAQTQAEPSVDESSGPHAVKPIRDHLKRFSPAEAPLGKSGQYNLVYDIIHWNWVGGKHGTFANSVLGRIAIERKPSDSQVIYEIEQRTRIGGVDNILEARIVCDTSELNPLRTWTLRSHQTAPRRGRDPLSELAEKGLCKDGRIRIEGDNHKYGFNAKSPVVTQWTMLDFLMREANPALNVTFDLLQDLSLFKLDQVLTYDGLTSVKIKGGKTVTLQTYAQTGQGVLPIHSLLDDRKRPQLITGSLLSWALAR